MALNWIGKLGKYSGTHHTKTTASESNISSYNLEITYFSVSQAVSKFSSVCNNFFALFNQNITRFSTGELLIDVLSSGFSDEFFNFVCDSSGNWLRFFSSKSFCEDWLGCNFSKFCFIVDFFLLI